MGWTGDIEIEGSHEHGYKIPAWVDGRSQARVIWLGWDGPRRSEADERYERVVTSSRELLTLLGSIERYANLELVSAELETRRPADEAANRVASALVEDYRNRV